MPTSNTARYPYGSGCADKPAQTQEAPGFAATDPYGWTHLTSRAPKHVLLGANFKTPSTRKGRLLWGQAGTGAGSCWPYPRNP
jgi:hypothetical protein